MRQESGCGGEFKLSSRHVMRLRGGDEGDYLLGVGGRGLFGGGPGQGGIDEGAGPLKL